MTSLLVIFFVVYGVYLVWHLAMLSLYDPEWEELSPSLPTTTDVIPLILGGILVFILFIIVYKIKWKSNINPSKFINIKGKNIYVKSLNSNRWMRIEDGELMQDLDIQTITTRMIPVSCPNCKLIISQVDIQQGKCSICNYHFM